MGRGWGHFRGSKRLQVGPNQSSVPTQTNGKAERFIQTLQNEWAYARPYRSNAERLHQLPRWLYRYNARRPHGGIGGGCPRLTPVNNVRGNYS